MFEAIGVRLVSPFLNQLIASGIMQLLSLPKILPPNLQ